MAFEIKGQTIDTSEYNLSRVEAAHAEFQLYSGKIADILLGVVFTANSADEALDQLLTQLRDYVAGREEFFTKVLEDLNKE